MKYLIDPSSLKSQGGGQGCKQNNCVIVCKLCTPLCPDHFIALYGIEPI